MTYTIKALMGKQQKAYFPAIIELNMKLNGVFATKKEAEEFLEIYQSNANLGMFQTHINILLQKSQVVKIEMDEVKAMLDEKRAVIVKNLKSEIEAKEKELKEIIATKGNFGTKKMNESIKFLKICLKRELEA